MLRSAVSRRRRSIVVVLGSVAMMTALAVAVVAPPLTVAQATRTWVSGVGDDANPCSRTAPCKTFAGAISKTAAGGEINCLDPGGFGAVTIVKSITIDCHNTEGGLAASGINGIIVNAGASDIVTLRGLDIDGFGSGLNGVSFLAGAALHIEHSTISNFRGGGTQNSNGVRIVPSTANAEVVIIDTVIDNNGAPSNGAGVFVKPTTATVKVTLDNVRLANNNIGVQADGTGNVSSNVDIRNLSSTGNAFHGIAVVTNATAVAMMIDGSDLSHNGAAGILCNGGGCTVRVGRSEITDNAFGTQPVNGGVIQSYQTNQIRGNANDGTRTNINQE